MDEPIAFTSSGRLGTTLGSQQASSSTVLAVASARSMPRTWGLRASSERRVPLQAGQGSSFRKRAMRLTALSVFALASAFSTVATAE